MKPDVMKPERMDPEKKRKLEAAGFRSTTVSEFLGLTPEDEAWIEMKLALTRSLREVRQEAGVTQTELARRIGSGQSRVAKMEAGSEDVSFDLLIKGLLAAGSTPAEIGSRLAGVPLKKAPSLRKLRAQPKTSRSATSYTATSRTATSGRVRKSGMRGEKGTAKMRTESC